MQSPQFDGGQISPALPYDLLSPDLDDTARLISDSSNTMVTAKGKLVKRPGMIQIPNTSVTGRVDRAVIVESLDANNLPLIYIVASVYIAASTHWTAYYIRLDAGAPAWTSLGTLRDVNASKRPHELTVSRDRVYVKGFPAAAGDKLGSVVFVPNAGTPYVTFWGLVGPTAPAALSAAAGWAASDNPVTVYFGWSYTYAYKTRTGHVSNRAPLQTNPSLLPSRTAPFTNKRPSMSLTGHSDTTNVPTICVYRTTDGGGSFYKLKEITNTGGSITFEDNGLASGAGSNVFHDPMPDQYLDTSAVSPSLTSNGPPPTVLADNGKVIGVDAVAPSTPVESYSARLWLGVGNVLFFSSQEELNEGVPEEAWPSGLLGNFFRFQFPIVNLRATTEALYVFTTEQTYWVRGSTRDTLQVLPLFADLGARRGHPRAVAAADKSVIWLTHDLRVCIARGGQRDFLSDPLNQTLNNFELGGCELYFARYAEYDKDWLIVGAVDPTGVATPTQWLFDFNQGERGLWNAPWQLSVSHVLAGRPYDTSSTARYLMWATWDGGTSSGLTRTDMSLATFRDYVWGVGTVDYNYRIHVSLQRNPTGNHINALRAPAMASVIYGVKLDRTTFGGDTDPTFNYFLDNASLTATATGIAPVVPPRRDASVGYKTLQWPINKACERVGVVLFGASADGLPFEMQTLTLLWTPDSGA